ncbi:MAG: hypothetical protein DHS20C16_02140 [Phycisphaerae bacterium]|nr:MAG: hypothetical protein DHS20C16_02140 [Phycisphaerae bacterium]
MIIPSIDISGGKAVQLRQGRELHLTDERDPVMLAAMFNRYGPVAVVDLDAAMGKGDNGELIEACCQVADCRVGGGIRSADDVRNWIKRGAQKIVVGTMASVEFFKQFPREWLVGAIDSKGEQVVDSGWTRDTNASVFDRAKELAPYCSEFLFTQVEREGMLAGVDLERATRLRELVDVPIVVAGGIRNSADIADLVRSGFGAQVGRALYENKVDLTDAWMQSVSFDASGLVPTIVQDARTGDVLMLAYSNAESLRAALSEGVGCYWSRSRKNLWRKGETSGNTQRLVSARFDCDRDAILFRVDQVGPTCHTGSPTCFGPRTYDTCADVHRTLTDRFAELANTSKPSYTQKLLSDPDLLASKLREEIEEVIVSPDRSNLRWECADVLYHLCVKMVADGVTPEQVVAELRSRIKPE